MKGKVNHGFTAEFYQKLERIKSTNIFKILPKNTKWLYVILKLLKHHKKKPTKASWSWVELGRRVLGTKMIKGSQDGLVGRGPAAKPWTQSLGLYGGSLSG